MDPKQEQLQQKEVVNRGLLEKRPGILMIGSPNVGKRTLLSRLLSLDFEGASDSSSDTLAYSWTINTKYYMADVSLWMGHLHDEFSIQTLPIYDNLAALVMVFDMSDLSSFLALKDWVSQTDIQKFDILLCIGNKVDLLPGHPAHVEYKRRLLKFGESSGNFSSELDYGISETEGSSLLGEEEPLWEIKRSCMDWCIEHNIEYIEACASNADFDNCLSVDGDSQGVQRLFGALSAHTWPGMLLKSGEKIDEPSLPEQQAQSCQKKNQTLNLNMKSYLLVRLIHGMMQRQIGCLQMVKLQIQGLVEHLSRKLIQRIAVERVKSDQLKASCSLPLQHLSHKVKFTRMK